MQPIAIAVIVIAAVILLWRLREGVAEAAVIGCIFPIAGILGIFAIVFFLGSLFAVATGRGDVRHFGPGGPTMNHIFLIGLALIMTIVILASLPKKK